MIKSRKNEFWKISQNRVTFKNTVAVKKKKLGRGKKSESQFNWFFLYCMWYEFLKLMKYIKLTHLFCYIRRKVPRQDDKHKRKRSGPNRIVVTLGNDRFHKRVRFIVLNDVLMLSKFHTYTSGGRVYIS